MKKEAKINQKTYIKKSKETILLGMNLNKSINQKNIVNEVSI